MSSAGRYERHRSANYISKNKDPLFMCVEHFYSDELNNLLTQQSTQYKQGVLDRAFLRAAELGNSKACQLLASAGSDVNSFESNLDHVNRYTESSSAFLPEHGQQVTWSKCHAPIGGSALHLAVENGHVNTVQTLIQLGTSVNFVDRNGVTPLMLACMKRGMGQIVHLLTLIPGCDVKVCDKQTKKSALHLAAEAGDDDVIKLLIDAGADVDALDSNQNTPLMLTLTPPSYENPKWPPRQTIKSIMALLHNDCQVNTRNSQNRTAIEFAVRAKNKEAVKLLLNRSALVSNAVLIKACLNVGDEQITRLLLNEAHLFDDELLFLILFALISSVPSKWMLNARWEEQNAHQIAKYLLKCISDHSLASTVREMTDQEISKIIGEDVMKTITKDMLVNFKTYGIFGYALLKGKFGIARLLYESGCRGLITKLTEIPGILEESEKHPYLKTWLPKVLKDTQISNKQGNFITIPNGASDENCETDAEENVFILGLDLDKAFDNVEPWDDVIHQCGHGMLDVNYTAREQSRAYLATNVLIYNN